jgi:hypothetical protein
MDVCPRVSRTPLHKIVGYLVLKNGKRQKILKSEQWFLKFDTHTYLDLRPMIGLFMDTDFDPVIYAR